jgi:hypothetical protein
MARLFLLVAGLSVYTLVIADYPAIAQKGLEQEAADRGLDLLRVIAQKPTFTQTFQNYGFDSPEQATDLKFGRPLQIYWVRLDRLRQFHSGSDVEQLLEPSFEVMYPVKARGEVTSSITVRSSQNQKTWKASRFGAANLIRRLTQFPQYKNSNSSFVVRIAGLNLYFLGDHISGQFMLTAIANRPDFQWEAGQTLPAQQVFSRLVPAAKARGDGPD